jgi:hypothetical protein
MIDEYSDGLRQRLRTALLVTLLAVVPLTALVFTARWGLHSFTTRTDVQAFSISFLSILFEAMPFVLLGALVSGLIEMFVPAPALLRYIPRGRLAQLAVGIGAGFFLPVCECGIIVIIRRLLRKGLPLRMALAYMLCAPIINPVVIVATFAAYRGRTTWLLIPVARVVLGLVLGLIIAAWAGRTKFAADVKVAVASSAAGDEQRSRLSFAGKLSAALDHTLNEFLDVVLFLIAGAAVAALLQTAVSRAALAGFGHSPVLAVPGMMGLALVLNLCSEADAFVAATLSSALSIASQLAFMVLGPMLQVKLILMYTMVFRRRLIFVLVATILAVVFVALELIALAEHFWGQGGFHGP